MGRLSDRRGVLLPLICGILSLGIGYVLAGLAPSLMLFALVHVLIGVGASTVFGPLIADASRWFTLRRGIAVAIAASGNYFSGAVWPPVLHHFVSTIGWRPTPIGVGVFSALAMLPLLLMFAARPPPTSEQSSVASGGRLELGLSPGALQVLLWIAGFACCVAMSMPQVHIVAYCGDLGYGVARGAEMLSLMLGFGVVSRVGSGFVADRIGAVPTLLLGSALQGLALLLYMLFDGLASLYLISALFGLFQGGIVPMYAVIVRQYFPPQEVGVRVGIVLMATLLGMAFGGWMSGLIFDFAGSYRAAFVNGLMWNAVNLSIVLWLMLRSGAPPRQRTAALSWLAIPRPTAGESHPHEGGDDPHAGAQGAGQASRHLRVAAAAAAIVDRDLQDTQARTRGAHLHLDVPTIGQFAHVQRQQRLASDGAERAHVGVAHTVEQAHAEARDPAGRQLVPGDAAGLAPPARARADDEIEMVGADRLDQRGDRRRIIGTVAIHEHQDIVGSREPRRREAGAAIAAADIDHLGARFARTRRGAVSAAAVGHDDPIDRRAGKRAHHRTDRLLLIERRYDDDDLRHRYVPSNSARIIARGRTAGQRGGASVAIRTSPPPPSRRPAETAHSGARDNPGHRRGSSTGRPAARARRRHRGPNVAA